MIDRFTEHLKQALAHSYVLATEHADTELTPLHLLLGLSMEKGSIAAEILSRIQLSTEKISGSIVKKQKRKGLRNVLPNLSGDAKRVLEKAVLFASSLGHPYVGTEHLLQALSEIQSPELNELFQTHQTAKKNLQEQLATVLHSAAQFPTISQSLQHIDRMGLSIPPLEKTKKKTRTKEKKTDTPALDYFGIDLTHPKQQKQIDPVIGREEEIERIIQILCRRTKNNPVLLGDPGVGKTAIVEGLAKRIAEGDVPDILLNKKIIALDLGMLIAGTIYRGEFEERLKQIIEEIKQNPNNIVFIDELHTIVGVGSGGGALDAANLLKPALARGQLHCIGATTYEEYKKHIESDTALERRFQSVSIHEPDIQKTKMILKGLKKYYEDFHDITIQESAVEAAVTFSSRYLHNKRQPDKAIDLLDEACAAKKVHRSKDELFRSLQQLQKQLREMIEHKQEAVQQEEFEKALQLKKEEEQLRQQIMELEQSIQERKKQKKETVTSRDIALVVSTTLHIPLAELTQEIGSHTDLSALLSERIVGQPQAIETVVRALHRTQLALHRTNRPRASFLFVGPSGVGKTELAKTIAHTLFAHEDAFIRIDLSEYSEGFGVSKLLGAPAGYVGFKEANPLTDKIKHHPYSVVLFDEIDKAHPDVLHLLLQALEDGSLSDATGKKISLTHTIIILTTTAGSEHLQQPSLGFQKKSELTDATYSRSYPSILHGLKEKFNTELINRLDAVVYFHPLTVSDIQKVVTQELEKLTQELHHAHRAALHISKEIIPYLSKKAFDPDSGARGVRTVIQDTIETELTEFLLAQKKLPKKISASIQKDHIVFKSISP